MADIKGFHLRVAARKLELQQLYPDGFLYIVTREVVEKRMTAGAVHQVSVANAARFLTEGTHDIATDEQIRAYEAHNAVIRETLISAQNAAIGRLNIRIKD